MNNKEIQNICSCRTYTKNNVYSFQELVVALPKKSPEGFCWNAIDEIYQIDKKKMLENDKSVVLLQNT